MFNHLRLRLTLIYLAAAVALVVVVGGAAYFLVNYYFESATDLALQRKMAHEFTERGLALPPELASAVRTWDANRFEFEPLRPSAPGDSHDETPPAAEAGAASPFAETEVELTAISVLLLDRHRQPISNVANSLQTPIDAAITAAAAQGNDRRTVQSAAGPRTRLLTYKLDLNAGDIAYIQLSRPLADQDRILRRLLGGLGVLSLGAIAGLGLLSWWLAGRSIQPAQQAWEQQQQFVANASHELRTPITLLRVSAETMQQNFADGVFDSEDNRMLLKDMLGECDHTARIVGDLLLLSRLDAGQLKLEQSLIPTGELLGEIARQVRPIAEARGIALQVAGADGTVRGDVIRLRQVLLILVDNALKHTPAGGTVTLGAKPRGALIDIQVADTGTGISAEHLEHVFDRFYQADAAHSAKTSAGLGLAIAKGLVEAQHGAIAIQSKPNVSTWVTISLPKA